MSSTVSDVFAFACTDAEWSELLDEEGDPPALLLAEVDAEAFRAAARHVNDSVEALLRACFEAFRAAASRDVPTDGRFARLREARRPQSRTLRQRWAVWVPLASGNTHYLGVTLEADFEGRTRRLYACIQGNATGLDVFEADLANPEAALRREGDFGYLCELPIVEGQQFDELAARVVETAWPLVRRYVDLVEKKRGRPVGIMNRGLASVVPIQGAGGES